MAMFTVGLQPGKFHPARFENQCLYQKPGRATVRLQDLCGICAEFYWLHMLT